MDEGKDGGGIRGELTASEKMYRDTPSWKLALPTSNDPKRFRPRSPEARLSPSGFFQDAPLLAVGGLSLSIEWMFC